MASFTKRGRSWRAQVKKNGVRRTATFDTKAEAREWAAGIESATAFKKKNTVPIGQLFTRYIDEVVPQHKGARWERLRLRKLERELGDCTVAELCTTDLLATWKAKRLTQVKPGTVIREMTLLNQVFEVARKEWRVVDQNPMEGIKKPKGPKPRDRLISADELAAMDAALGYSEDCVVLTKQQQVGLALHIALETAMRAGEILRLERTDKKVVAVGESKNGEGRDVPLSPTARALVERIPVGGFTLSAGELSSLFNKARRRCGYPNGENGGFTFHDSRANALTMLSKKLDVLALAKMVGHRDPRSLMIYYREDAALIADKLG